MATVAQTPAAAATLPLSPSPFPRHRTLADLVAHLGNIPLERIRMEPLPGHAIPDDVVAIDAHEDRLCELIDGILVEKTMGLFESQLAIALAFFIGRFLDTQNLGVVAGADGTIRLLPNQVRIPDLAFYSWRHFPDGNLPREPIPSLTPDLAVEILSKSNTKAEMRRKLEEYFAAGTQLVWYIDAADRSARAYTAIDQYEELRGAQVLSGGNVLPGFTVSIDELFGRVERHM